MGVCTSDKNIHPLGLRSAVPKNPTHMCWMFLPRATNSKSYIRGIARKNKFQNSVEQCANSANAHMRGIDREVWSLSFTKTEEFFLKGINEGSGFMCFDTVGFGKMWFHLKMSDLVPAFFTTASEWNGGLMPRYLLQCLAPLCKIPKKGLGTFWLCQDFTALWFLNQIKRLIAH